MGFFEKLMLLALVVAAIFFIAHFDDDLPMDPGLQ